MTWWGSRRWRGGSGALGLVCARDLIWCGSEGVWFGFGWVKGVCFWLGVMVVTAWEVREHGFMFWSTREVGNGGGCWEGLFAFFGHSRSRWGGNLNNNNEILCL